MDKDLSEIIATVRDILLPLVEPDEICGDYLACTCSNYECLECLAKKIRTQYETQEQAYQALLSATAGLRK